MLELLVVIAITVMLTGLLMPSLRYVHENANRIVCMSHLQQMGQAFHMYVSANNERLPISNVLHIDHMPQDLMAARRGGPQGTWDGLGLLFLYEYCPAPECFYCPSHHGNHGFERYADAWFHPVAGQPIYTNYHYAGDIEWTAAARRRTLDDGLALVLAADGLRTASDFNHLDGLNVLRADGSVRWRDDTQNILERLPTVEAQLPLSGYNTLWDLVEAQH